MGMRQEQSEGRYASQRTARSAARQRRVLPLTALVLGSWLLSPIRAFAGEPPDPLVSAESQALFDEGMALMKAGKHHEACPKLAASLRLEAGTGTRYFLGECYERIGRLASAYASFRDAEESAKRKDQKDEARGRWKTIEPRLIRVLIEVLEPARDIPGLTIQRGGVTLSSGQLGTAVPVDPGSLEISATAPGKRRWATTLDASKEGVTYTVQVPLLEDFVELPAPSPSPPATVSPWSTQRILGVAVTGLGVVAAGIGGAFGGAAIDKKNASERDAHCTSAAVCDEIGLALRREGRAAGDASTAMFIAAGAAVAGGLVLFFTAPSATDGPPKTVSLAGYAGIGTLGLRGRW